MQKFARLGLLFVIILLCLFRLPAAGQSKKVFIVTGKIVPEVETSESGFIEMTKSGAAPTKIEIPKNGRFRLELEYFNEYTLTFMLAGHFSKTILVNTDIPQEVWKRDSDFPPFPMIVQLFKEIEGIDKSFTLKPSGRVFYGKQTDNFEKESIFNDIQIAEQITTATTQTAQVKKEAGTITKQESLDLALKQKTFDQSISEADVLFKRGEYPAALLKYKDAQRLFPEKAYASDRITEIQDLMKVLENTEKQKAELEQKYKNAIALGNGSFDQKSYQEARPHYQEALQYKPADAIATGRIQEIDRLLALQEKQKQVDALIAQADNLFKAKKLDQAVALYTQVKQIVPENEYSQNQINLITQEKLQVAKLEEQEKTFTQTIDNGDKLARKKDYLQAINSYKKALELKPDNKLASDKLAEVERAVAEIETDKKYQETILQADQALAGNDLQKAKMYYQEALKLKSTEAYATNKLAEIKVTETNETRFIELTANAEKAVSNQNYDESVQLLTQALQLKPKDPTIQKRLDEISILKKQQVADTEFEQTIQRGDQQLSQQKYDQAINSYRDALKIKPNNEVALNKISGVEQTLAVLEKQKQYLATIAQADKSFDKKDYINAQADYRKAQSIKADEAYPAGRIKEIEQILEKEKQAKILDDNYNSAIAKADKSFDSQGYADARKAYMDALTIKPGETYPTGRITKIDEILAEKAKQQKAEADFLALVTKGDAAYGQKDYEGAKGSYSNALDIKPTAEEVKAKIKNIDSILQKIAEDKKKEEELKLALAAKEKAYSDAIAKADKSFNAENYADAKTSYSDALTIKPEETYPTGRITKIDEILAEKAKQQKAEANFLALVTKGDAAFGQKDYEGAKGSYSSALGIKPTAEEVKTKIKNIDSILQKIAEDKKKEEELKLALAAKEKAYTDAIVKADKSFTAENYADAKTSYSEALAIKPGETYPTGRITKIDEILAEKAKQQKAEADFLALVTKGDAAFGQKDYEGAKGSYSSALGIKPTAEEVKTKIRNIDSILQKIAEDKKKEEELKLALAAKEKAYSDAIAKADKSFTAENYADAKTYYSDALTIKPGETYPTGRITKIDEILAEKVKQQKTEADFLALVTKGNAAFAQKDYEGAKGSYTNALSIKPTAEEVKAKIKNIDSILQKIAEDKKKEEELKLALAAKEKAYSDAIAKADKSFTAENYTDAKTSYTEALGIKPNDSYSKGRIAKIDEILAEKAKQQKTEADFLAFVNKGDAAFAQKDYEGAKGSYSNALGMKPNAEDVKAKIKNIDSILQKIAEDKKKEEELKLALAAKEKAYSDAIAKADKSFTAENYADAKTYYSDALTIKPGETYPTGRITKIDEILAEKAKQQKIEADFLALVTKGDAAFGQKDYEGAKGIYSNALGIKPTAEEVKTKIKNIDSILQKIAEDKKKEEELKLALAAKEKAYSDAIAKADKSFTAENYADAKTYYSDALTIKPGETYPTGRITKIDEILAEKAKQQKIEADFLALVTKGDAAFGQKDYEGAKGIYSNALGIKPTAEEVKTKIKNIDSILQKIAEDKKKEEELKLALAAKEKAYSDAVAKADKSFTAENYADARTSYTEALGIKPGETYPTGRITKIDEILAEKAKQQKTEADFLALVTKGDASFGQKDYEGAKGSYSNALDIKPTAEEVKSKIKNIDSILQKIAEDKKKEEARLQAIAAANEKAYTETIAKGNKQIDQKSYSDAKVTFQEAKKLKPTELLPDEMIAKIDNLIAENERELASARLKEEAYQKSIKEAQGNSFKEAMAKADKAFGENDFNTAKTGYQTALAINETDPIAKQKLGQTEAKLAELAKLTLAYNTAINAANKFVGDKKYKEAKEKYQEALQYLPDSDYPKRQVEKLDALLAQAAAELQKEESYASKVKEAESLLSAKDYTSARSTFVQASEIKPSEPLPVRRIKEIDKLLADLALEEANKKASESGYMESIKRADEAFTAKEYTSARLSYSGALSVKPNEQYPKDQIAKIDVLLKELAAADEKAKLLALEEAQRLAKEKAIKEQYDKAISEADKAFTAKQYPAARTGYSNALSILPNEKYPKDQISKIDGLMASEEKSRLAVVPKEEVISTTPKVNVPVYNAVETEKATETRAQSYKVVNTYEEAISKADDSFGIKDYTVARFYYYKAMDLKPKEEYPKNQIELIRKLVDAELTAVDRSGYEQAIAQADDAFKIQNYTVAKFFYNKALGIKSWEKYPKDRIQEVQALTNSLLSEREEKEYHDLIAKGDEAYTMKDISVARFYYNKAIAIKKDETYPRIKIKDIQKIIDQDTQDGRKLEYNKLIELADKALQSESYSIARFNYNKALNLKPEEKYPKDQLKRIKEKLDKQKE